MATHTPIVVWMLYSFFKDVPVEILKASDIDGCSRLRQLVSIALPLVRTGIVAAGLFVAQLSASSTIAILPAIVMGWMTQKALVKDLTLGAVKG